MSAPAAEDLPLAGSMFLDTDDPETARREMSKILAPHAMTPLGMNGFRVRHHHARISGMSVNFIEYRPGALIRADLSRRFYLIHNVLSGDCRIGGGMAERSLGADDFTVINPTEPFSVIARGNCRQIVIKLEARLLSDVANRHFSVGSDTPIRFLSNGQPWRSETLSDMVKLICREADRSNRENRGLYSETLMAELFATALIETLPNSLSADIDRARGTRNIGPWYVKRVEEYIELHAEKPLRVSDMAALAGVSERSLYYAFKTWRGTTPKAYLKSVRLDRARTELLGLSSKAKGVAAIARECGFIHLGNFARDYRARFGERPVETLRFRLPAAEKD